LLALNFVGPFCTCSPRSPGGCHLASEVARTLGVEIRVENKGMEYLRIVENPRFGHGRGLNPCIDCRIYMLRRAAALMEETSASFVVTGEVLAQRPMSQHRRALDLIERESGLVGRLLRPLSAHLLEPTIPEREGLVNREALLGIRGRSRAAQLDLARKKSIDVFGCPAGGCLLTDPIIARRMRDLFARCPDWGVRDAKLATIGRHLRLREDLKVVLGRNREENERLEGLADGLPRVELRSGPGPTALLCGSFAHDNLATVAGLLLFFARKARASEAVLTHNGTTVVCPPGRPVTQDEVALWTI